VTCLFSGTEHFSGHPNRNRTSPDLHYAGFILDHMVEVIAQKLREVASATKRADAIPDLKPWREVGWIFRDGEAVAIERHDDETRVRQVEVG